MTIIETVIACVILCLGLATTLAAMTMMRGVAHSSGIRLESLHEARSVLESLTAMEYGASELDVGTHEIDGWRYTVSMTAGFETTKDVALKVGWYDVATRRTNEMMLHTSIALCQHP
jgi:hypothetical protein